MLFKKNIRKYHKKADIEDINPKVNEIPDNHETRTFFQKISEFKLKKNYSSENKTSKTNIATTLLSFQTDSKSNVLSKTSNLFEIHNV